MHQISFNRYLLNVVTDNSCKLIRTIPAMEGQALLNHTVGSFRVTERDFCEVKCFLHNSCVSFNLGPQESSGHVCELSDSDHIQYPQDLQNRMGFIYVAFEVRDYCFAKSLIVLFVIPYTRTGGGDICPYIW